MTERDPRLLSIGRFSAATRLSVKALRLYDELGLLVPEFVDDSNGYRYYGPSQAARAEAIRVLRSVDMPLEEILRLLAAAPQLREELMAGHLERLRRGLVAQERKLAVFADLADGRRGLMPFTVEEKDIPAVRVASIEAEVDLSSIGAAIGEGFGTIMGTLGPAGLGPSGPPFIIYHDVIDETTPGTVEMCVPIVGAVALSGRVVAKEVPGGAAASTVHRGPYDEVAPAYHAVSEWMARHGYEPSGPPREVYLNDPADVPPGDLLTEVIWGIQEVGT